MHKHDRPRVTLVGPIAPYRGGIAQYNTRLHDALSEISHVYAVSFKRQYPKWLYPGGSDRDAQSKLKSKGTDYIIDVYSPFSLKRALDKIIAQKPDVVLVTWWTLFWQPGLAYITRQLRKRNVKVIYVCHNVFDHDSKKILQRVSRFFLGQSSGYLVHAREQADLLRTYYPYSKVLQRPLPIYNHYPAAKGLLPKRGRLELLFFGFIRPYKGLDTLVAALQSLKDEKIFTTIVGKPWANEKELKKEITSQGIPNLELYLDYASDDEAAEYFERADVVVLPYKSATGSAVASLAYNYQKPILGTRVGGLKDVVLQDKTGWLVEADSPSELAAVLRGLSRQKAKGTSRAIEEFCREHSWEAMAHEIIAFSKQL